MRPAAMTRLSPDPRRARLRPRRAAVAALLALAAAAPAGAEQPLWELGLGVAGLSVPHYRGSDQNHHWVLPVPYGVYRGDILRATRDGARAVLLETERFDFDISVSASPPTRSSDNDARSGMPDLDAAVEIGPSLKLKLARGAGWELQLQLPLRAAFTVGSGVRGIGWTASPALDLDLDHRGWNVGLRAEAPAASHDNHAHYYSVAPEFATPGRPAYAAPGGRAGWSLRLGASRRFGRLWLGSFVRADSVAGAAFEASPLVRQRENFTVGLALSWVLLSSQTQVPADR